MASAELIKVRGVIASLPKADRELVEEHCKELRAKLEVPDEKTKHAMQIALAVVLFELQEK